jgi:hypothetical protein
MPLMFLVGRALPNSQMFFKMASQKTIIWINSATLWMKLRDLRKPGTQTEPAVVCFDANAGQEKVRPCGHSEEYCEAVHGFWDLDARIFGVSCPQSCKAERLSMDFQTLGSGLNFKFKQTDINQVELSRLTMK